MQGHQHPCGLQQASVLGPNLDGLFLAAGTVDDDQGCRRAAGSNLVHHLPGLADVVQHQLKSEFGGQPHGGDDVVCSMGMKMHDALALEDLNHRRLANLVGL